MYTWSSCSHGSGWLHERHEDISAGMKRTLGIVLDDAIHSLKHIHIERVTKENFRDIVRGQEKSY